MDSEKYREARWLIRETEKQFKDSIGTEEQKYWQGRKDGSRLVFGILNEMIRIRVWLNPVRAIAKQIRS